MPIGHMPPFVHGALHTIISGIYANILEATPIMRSNYLGVKQVKSPLEAMRKLGYYTTNC